MAKKAFFERRTEAKIQDLDIKLIESPKNLSKIIEDLNPRTEAIVIDTRNNKVSLTHPSFRLDDPLYGSRRSLRGVKRSGDTRVFPNYISLQQPRSGEEAVKFFRKGHLPFKLRNKSMFEAMSSIPEENNFHVGYMFRPVIGNNQSPILVPFWALGGGNQIDVYSQRIREKLKQNSGTEVLRDYSPEVIVKVPSTEEKHGRYTVKWHNVTRRSIHEQERAIIGWGTRPAYGVIHEDDFVQREDAAPLHEFYASISHEGKHRHGESFEFTQIHPHSIGSWYEIIRDSIREGDYATLEMSQYALLSREDAAYWNKLNNNVLVIENGLSEKPVIKHPRIDHLSVLFGRRVQNNLRRLNRGEVQTTLYWDAERDGKIAKYPVLPGEE